MERNVVDVESTARRQRLEPDERKAQILAVARRLFRAGTYGSVSTADIAAEAGVTRGLINHYFGGKRGLYLAVVRQLMVTPALVAENLPRTTVEQRVAIAVDRLLDVVERHKETWLTSIAPDAIGHDPEVERIILEGDEIAADRVLQAAMMTDVVVAREQLRAMIRSYGAMLRSATREWLVRGTLSRTDLHILFTDSVLHLLRVIYPAIAATQEVG